MSDRRPAQTIGELDIHLSNVQSRLGELAVLMGKMATRDDIEDIKQTMATLATKAEVENKISELRAEVERSKPSTLARQFVSICLGLSVIAGAAGVGLAIVRAIDRIPVQIIQVPK